MTKTYDVIVAGLGGMGTAALYHLAARGHRVLGLEKFRVGHTMGSSHGATRILRLAYFEGSTYVPFVQRARDLWRETGAQAGEQLFFEVGSLDIAPETDTIVESARQSCLDNDLPHETLTAAEIKRRFPAFALPDGAAGLLQPNGGFVACERAIAVHAALARHHGATIREDEPMLGFEPTAGGGVRVRTTAGYVEGGRLIVSPGPWIGDIIPRLRPVTTVIRQTLGWFTPTQPAALSIGSFPVFTLKVEEGHLYGFPLWGPDGFKLGSPHYGDDVYDPNDDERRVSPRHEPVLRRVIERYIPAAIGPTERLKACLYTNTPDEHFVIDTLPGFEAVIVASPCSGHGFKFASAVGEALADLAGGRAPRVDLTMFRLDREALATGTRGEVAGI